ncbi:hypothetical protein C9374_000570 [Naegleria lovaniensis]|uniref:Ankyrin repeat-containing protein n=1 Tax=Naegleria lovaniensis TaxID=51637 RepID=A0AA88KP92_NAELO|nr:uncharacterized protein C9374_000570 [Naegleria lovaniensis]KAG2388406.1 hypothetical protein C9374_000570 [Naegleria lovaniensis]
MKSLLKVSPPPPPASTKPPLSCQSPSTTTPTHLIPSNHDINRMMIQVMSSPVMAHHQLSSPPNNETHHEESHHFTTTTTSTLESNNTTTTSTLQQQHTTNSSSTDYSHHPIIEQTNHDPLIIHNSLNSTNDHHATVDHNNNHELHSPSTPLCITSEMSSSCGMHFMTTITTSSSGGGGDVNLHQDSTNVLLHVSHHDDDEGEENNHSSTLNPTVEITSVVGSSTSSHGIIDDLHGHWTNTATTTTMSPAATHESSSSLFGSSTEISSWSLPNSQQQQQLLLTSQHTTTTLTPLQISPRMLHLQHAHLVDTMDAVSCDSNCSSPITSSSTCSSPASSYSPIPLHWNSTTLSTTTQNHSSSSSSTPPIIDPKVMYANYMNPEATDSKSLLLQYCVLGMEQEFKQLLLREIHATRTREYATTTTSSSPHHQHDHLNFSTTTVPHPSTTDTTTATTATSTTTATTTDTTTATTTTTDETIEEISTPTPTPPPSNMTTNETHESSSSPSQQLLNQQETSEQEPFNTTSTTIHEESTTSPQLILTQSKVLTSLFTYHDHDKCTLFHLASKFNQVHLLEFMYEMVPSMIFMKDSKQAHPLFYAVSNDAKESVAFLCNAVSVTLNNDQLLVPISKYVNDLDMYGGCCLYLALQKSYFELADLLLLFGANIDISFKTGETMLHRAITERRLDIVEYLCKKGANLLKQNQNNENPLFNVFVHQKKKLSDLNEKTVNGFFTTNNANFCKNGAQFLQNLLKSDCFSSEVIMKGLKQKNSHGRTMFQECIVKGDLPSFKVLLAYLTTRQSSETLSWFVNDVENQKNRTALHLSVVYKQFHMFKMLVESIPGIAKLDAVDSDGKTALDIAKDTNQENVVELFNEMAELQKPKKKKGFGLKSLFSRNKSKTK